MIYKRSGKWHLDATICGVRYREALHTTDRREALALEKKRVAEIQAGKGRPKVDVISLDCPSRLPQQTVSPRNAA